MLVKVPFGLTTIVVTAPSVPAPAEPVCDPPAPAPTASIAMFQLMLPPDGLRSKEKRIGVPRDVPFGISALNWNAPEVKISDPEAEYPFRVKPPPVMVL